MKNTIMRVLLLFLMGLLLLTSCNNTKSKDVISSVDTATLSAMASSAESSSQSGSEIISAATSRPEVNIKITDTKPVLDGKVTEQEWGKPIITMKKEKTQDTYTDIDAVNVEAVPDNIAVYSLWDRTNVYFAAVVHDPVHFNQYSDTNSWNGDAFEFDVGFNLNDSYDRNRNTFSLNNKGIVSGYSYRVQIGVNGAVEENRGNTIKSNAQFIVSRKGEYSTYEVSFKWTDISPDGRPEMGKVFYFMPQALFADNGDCLGYKCWCMPVKNNPETKYELGYAKLSDK